MKIDIVSDVVCPWCIVGFRQLEQALARSSVSAEVHWHPFELNPGMPSEGQNLKEHITQKYGISDEQSLENRQRLTDLGESLGFEFNFSESSRMVNTFKAHQLLHWAGLTSLDAEHNLKMALFKAYFTHGKDINDDSTLIDVCSELQFEASEVRSILQRQAYEADVRTRQKQWTEKGISGVPAMVFNEKYLITGAQGVENYVSIIEQIERES